MTESRHNATPQTRARAPCARSSRAARTRRVIAWVRTATTPRPIAEDRERQSRREDDRLERSSESFPSRPVASKCAARGVRTDLCAASECVLPHSFVWRNGLRGFDVWLVERIATPRWQRTSSLSMIANKPKDQAILAAPPDGGPGLEYPCFVWWRLLLSERPPARLYASSGIRGKPKESLPK